MQLVLARNYIENLREEVKKGMREKSEQGIYPGRAPFGYSNNKADRTIEVHPENASTAKRIFELYATGQYSLLELRAAVRKETGKTLVNLNTMLRNPFYVGQFVWSGKTYLGTQPRLITNELFERVQDILTGRNKRKCRKHNFAFRGLLSCAEDNCAMTAEVQKGKYIYYRCSGYRGKCSTPYFREEEISQKLGDHVKDGEVDGHDKLLSIDLKKSFDILKASGYRGYCSMEFDAPGEPYAPTTRLIEQTLLYLA
jgi:site-specific DNA recombinase